MRSSCSGGRRRAPCTWATRSATCEAARAAGVAAIGVTWGAFSYDGLAAEQPDAIATTPAELAAILSADG